MIEGTGEYQSTGILSNRKPHCFAHSRVLLNLDMNASQWHSVIHINLESETSLSNTSALTFLMSIKEADGKSPLNSTN